MSEIKVLVAAVTVSILGVMALFGGALIANDSQPENNVPEHNETVQANNYAKLAVVCKNRIESKFREMRDKQEEQRLARIEAEKKAKAKARAKAEAKAKAIAQRRKVNRSIRSGRINKEPLGGSCFTVENYDNMLANTALKGCGKHFKRMETKYGVNGLFAIAVACHESGNGYHDMGCKNYFGMIGLKFKNEKECIMHFGKLISGPLYKGSGRTTIEEVGARYCSSSTWVPKIKTMMECKIRQAL